MNPLLSLLSGGSGFADVMMKAVGAAMRGESPEAFVKSLAQTNPKLRGMDLDNLEQTAHALAKKNGVDENELIESLKSGINRFM